jgi:hypothetical protein
VVKQSGAMVLESHFKTAKTDYFRDEADVNLVFTHSVAENSPGKSRAFSREWQNLSGVLTEMKGEES